MTLLFFFGLPARMGGVLPQPVTATDAILSVSHRTAERDTGGYLADLVTKRRTVTRGE